MLNSAMFAPTPKPSTSTTVAHSHGVLRSDLSAIFMAERRRRLPER
jgi:hypothetical protein